MGLSVVLFAALRLERAPVRPPMIEPSLFRNRAFVAGLLVLTSFFVAMTGFMLVYNLFVQLGMGSEPLEGRSGPDTVRLRHRAGVGPVRRLARAEVRSAGAALGLATLSSA